MNTRFAGTRDAVESGRFYPGSPERLGAQVAGFLADGASPHAAPVRAVVAPHAGYTYSGSTAGLAYARLAGASCARIVLLAPSHYVPFAAISTGTYATLATPLGDVPVDTAACARLLADPCFVARTDTHADEHACGNQLPFLAALFPQVPVVPLVCGQLDDAAIGQATERLAQAFPEATTLWVASSDFTHFGADFGFVPFRDHVHERIEELDQEGIGRILALDDAGFADFLATTGATICGAEPIRILLRVLRQLGVCGGELLGYTSSGRMTGDERHSVSYAAIAFGEALVPETGGLSAEEGDMALHLARRAIAADLAKQGFSLPADVPPGLRRPGACFVTLTLDGQLRGCIGDLEATDSLADGIVRNARSAAFEDWRFQPLTAEEFARATLEISVLSPLRRIAGPDEIVVGTHGILVEKGRRSAVFLPQVATECGWDRRTTLEHLCRKAGLPADAWQRGCTFKVFTAQEIVDDVDDVD